MSKNKFLFICFVLLILISIFIYTNYDRISKYISNKEWQLADSVATISLDKYIGIQGNDEGLILIDSEKIQMFSNSTKEIYSETLSFKTPIHDTCGKYFVIAEKNGSKLYLFSDKQKKWEFELIGEITGLSVNKNGYVSVIYMQSGYKSLVKTIGPDGKELFTNYLASSYAVDTCISFDNKLLAIAEVNTDGIKIESTVKIIQVDKISDENVESINLGDGLVIDTEFEDKNNLLVVQDNRTLVINGNLEIIEIEKINYNDIILVTIENDNNIVLVKKNNNGLFDNSGVMCIYDAKGNKKEFLLNSTPKQIYALGKVIAVDQGSEILFVNLNGKLIKRCELSGEVKEIQLYDGGNMAGLIFRDRIELVKI
jgi:hypothetical protein